MNDKTKTALIVAAAIVAVLVAGYVGWNAMRDNSVPVESPGYARLSPEERERIRTEGLARRAGLKATSSGPAQAKP